jgi:hypothetical protein
MLLHNERLLETDTLVVGSTQGANGDIAKQYQSSRGSRAHVCNDPLE